MRQKKLAARKFLCRRTFTESQCAFGERTKTFDECVRHDARRSLEDRHDAEFVHLRTDANADRGQPAEVNDLRLEFLDLGEFCVEVLLIRGNAEGTEDRAAEFLHIRREILVVAFAVVGGVMDHGPLFVLQARHEFGGDLVLIDHGAVDAMHFLVVVCVGYFRQHRAPDDDREAEAVIHVDRTHGH